MYGARAAFADATAVFRSVEIEHIPEHPKERSVGRDVDTSGAPVHGELDRHTYNDTPTRVCRRCILRKQRSRQIRGLTVRRIQRILLSSVYGRPKTTSGR